MFRFAQPEYLYLLIIVPILWGLFIYGRYRSRRNLAKYGNPSVLAPLMTDVSKYKPWINYSTIGVYCHCIYVGAAPIRL